MWRAASILPSVGRVPVSPRQLTIGRTPRSLAQAALELPAVGRASDGNDVEIEALVPLVRVLVRNECDLAQEGAAGIIVALGGQHLQILIVQLASRRRFALICGLDDGDIGNGTASQTHQRARPTDRLPHIHLPCSPCAQSGARLSPRHHSRQVTDLLSRVKAALPGYSPLRVPPAAANVAKVCSI